MKFLIDAQLPKRFCIWIEAFGYETKHTLDLPEGNRTSDNNIIDIAECEEWVVVSKDDDFVQSYLINRRPSKLLFVATGNISNTDLEKIIRANLVAIAEAFTENNFIEISREIIVIHE